MSRNLQDVRAGVAQIPNADAQAGFILKQGDR